jgi:pimeloyl-ACP methyl ester carboxylesterase
VTRRETELVTIEYDGQSIEIALTVSRRSENLIIFLHGFGCAKEAFDDAFTLPELANFSLCSFDFPGHGGSVRLDSLYSLQAYADITNILIDRMSHDRVFVIGHSMGGAVGLIASRDRSDLGCLVSVEGNLVGQDCGLVSRSTAAQSQAYFARAGYENFKNELANSDRRDSRAWAQWYSQADPSALHGTARSLVEWSDSCELLDLFNALACKAYVYGDQEDKGYLLRLLAPDRTYLIPDAGHFAMVDNPVTFYSVLGDILSAAAEFASLATPRLVV